MRAAIVTALYGDKDVLKPVLDQQGADVDWVLVTDDTRIQDGALGWRVIHDQQPMVLPARAAKAPKFQPWRYTDAPASVWVDAAFRVTSPTFATDALQHAKPIAQFVHPWRACLYDEATAVAGLGLDSRQVVDWQTSRYREDGHPAGWGLWATGVIARRHTPAVKRMGAAWAAEVDAGSVRDQISQPHVLRTHRLKPTPLPGTHLANRWLKYEEHQK